MAEQGRRPERRNKGNNEQPLANGALVLFDSGPWAHRVASQNLDQYHHGKVSDLDGFFDQLHVVSFPHAQSLTARFSPRHWFHQVSAAGAPGPVAAETWASSIHLPRFLRPGASAGTALALLQALALARRIAANHHVAAAAANDPFLRGLAAILLARSASPPIPSVLVVRGDNEQVRRLRGRAVLSVFRQDLDMDRAFERWVFSQVDLVIADRDYYAEYALSHGARPGRVVQVGMAVHEDFYGEPPGPWDESWGPRGLQPDKPLLSILSRPADRHVLVVGRLADEKYPLDALEAVALARRRTGLDVVVIFSGTGPLGRVLQQGAQDMGMGEALFLPGNLDRPRLMRAMAECDAVLAPCTGFALAEAALRAAPIVAYDWEWHSEVVQAERTGLFAPFRDRVAMGKALARLLEDQALARTLGAAARRRALEHFAPGRNIQNLRRAYREVMDRVGSLP